MWTFPIGLIFHLALCPDSVVYQQPSDPGALASPAPRSKFMSDLKDELNVRIASSNSVQAKEKITGTTPTKTKSFVKFKGSP